MQTELQWTSLEAYREIYPTLGTRRQQTLAALVSHIEATATNPTAVELERRAGVENGVYRKRLTELRDLWNAIHNGPARECGGTGPKALTWVLGPDTSVGTVPALQERSPRLDLEALLEKAGNPESWILCPEETGVAFAGPKVEAGNGLVLVPLAPPKSA